MTLQRSAIPELYYQICSDLCREYPEHTMRIARYLLDLNRRLMSRGVERTLCIELPQQGKLYDKGLSTGTFAPTSGSLYNGVSKDRKNFGISPLLELTFRQCGSEWLLRQPTDPRLVFYTRTLLYAAKKLLRQAPPHVEEEGKVEFFSTDSEINSPEFTQREIETIRAVSARMVPLVFPAWDNLDFRHGPGAVSDLSKVKEDKYSFPTWTDKLESWFPSAEFAGHCYGQAKTVRTRKLTTKVCCVPKTLDKVRVITVEPTSNQFFQQGLRGFLVGNLTAIASRCIDVTDQSASKEAARKASIDGLAATVDLKSASDYLSLELVRLIIGINPPLMDMLEACRSDEIIDLEGNPCTLKKYAGQGNATTFIVQSMVYTTLCISSILIDANLALTRKNIDKAARNVRVFGDDIVLPSANLATFSRILQGAGLRINMTKTHYSGFFREACGGDYFHGYDVTPFYMKEFTLEKGSEELVSWCDVSNNAYTKGLLGTSFWMRQRDLPVNSPSGFGYVSRLPFRYSPNGRRWNSELQRFEYLDYVQANRSKLRVSELTYGRLYKYFVEKPTQQVSWEGRLTVRTAVALRRQWVA